MRLIVVSDVANPAGGAERIAIETAIGVAQRGHEVHFICAVGPVCQELLDAKVHVHLAEVAELKQKGPVDLLVSGLWSRKCHDMTKALLSSCDAKDTVVHLHAWQRALTASTVKAISDSKLPFVLTLHEYGIACPNQGFFDYQRFEVCHRKGMSLSCLTTHCDTRTYAHKLWRAGRVFLQHSAGHLRTAVTDVIYLSDLSKRVLTEYLGPQARWHDVRNPQRLQRSARVQAEANSEFLFLGRVSLEKGVDVFVQAAHAAGVIAVVGGDGPQLGQLKTQHQGPQYLGWLDREAVLRSLSRARALVFPSRWYEGQPLVVQEALSMGIPVIVSDATGACEVVTDGQTGLHFKSMDVHDLAQKLRALNDNELVTRMSQQAYERYWLNPQTQDSYLDELLQVYQRSLEAHTA